MLHRTIITLCSILLCFPVTALTKTQHGHEPLIYYGGMGAWDVSDLQGHTLQTWEADAWVGGDTHRLKLHTTGERKGRTTEEASVWGLYSRTFSPFWNIEGGIRQDWQPNTTTYGVVGFSGMMPMFLETEIHTFVSEEGKLSARLEQDVDLPITQRLITRPYWEVEAFAQDVAAENRAAGFAKAEIGLETRFELHRLFAPYLDLHYERKLGETALWAEQTGKSRDAFTARFGVKVGF